MCMQLCLNLCDPWTEASQVPLSVGVFLTKGLNPGLLCLLIGRRHTYTIGNNIVLPSSKASLVAQTVKNLPAVRETWV